MDQGCLFKLDIRANPQPWFRFSCFLCGGPGLNELCTVSHSLLSHFSASSPLPFPLNLVNLKARLWCPLLLTFLGFYNSPYPISSNPHSILTFTPMWVSWKTIPPSSPSLSSWSSVWLYIKCLQWVLCCNFRQVCDPPDLGTTSFPCPPLPHNPISAKTGSSYLWSSVRVPASPRHQGSVFWKFCEFSITRGILSASLQVGEYN